jgi:alkanesulfonate monooxygenase SsuD/methylene tetrahydromethanopterin reductase-like flavin-dependent oxidoreductase (luciferase family)
VAATVPRIRIGTLVASNTFRHPAIVAKASATTAKLSGDRFVLGIGAGWQANEHETHGIPLDPPPVRLRALAEACVVLRRLLTEDDVSHDGEHYRLRGATHRPRPGGVPLLVGVKGDRALGIAARHADEWNLWASPSTFADRSAALDRRCEEVGRDPASIERSAQALILFTDGPAPVDVARWEEAGLPFLRGTVAELQDHVGAYAEAGLTELVVPDFTFGDPAGARDAYERFITEVAAPFRAAA